MTKHLFPAAALLSLAFMPQTLFASMWETILGAGPSIPGSDLVVRTNGSPVTSTGVAYSLAVDIGARNGWRGGLDGSVALFDGPAGRFLPEDKLRAYQLGLHLKYWRPIGSHFGAHALLGIGAYETTDEWFALENCSVEFASCEHVQKSTSTGFHPGGKAALGGSVRMSPSVQLILEAEYNVTHVPDDVPGATTVSHLDVRLGLGLGPAP